jgi:hypothetical protein
MKTTAKIALASAVLLIPAALFASRQAVTCCQGGADGIVKRIAQKLDLSAELAAVKTAREHQFDAIHTADFNEAAIRSAAAEVGQAETALAVTRGKLVAEIRPVLTAEQQAQAQRMLAQAKARVEGFLDHVRQRLQADPLAGL